VNKDQSHSNNATNDDLETIMTVLDRAMSSDDTRVQDALRRLMVTSALVDQSQDLDRRLGPLASMRRQMQDLERRCTNLQCELEQLKTHLGSLRLVPMETVQISSLYGSEHLTSINLESILGPNAQVVTNGGLGPRNP
jgi:uncharacterized protein (DUF3084 family)